MKKSLVIVLAFFLMGSSHSEKTVPLMMSYQGRLLGASGMPVNGTFDMTFRIYDMAVEGNLLWEETHAGVVVSNSLFDVILPPPYEFPLSAAGFEEPLQNFLPIESWLEVEVEMGVPIMPRTRIYSSPFSMLSHGLAGHIFTSPGHVMLIPGPQVSDCTYVPLEMAVDSTVTRIRMKPYIPVNDCTYVPLELKVDAIATSIHLHPPDPVMPDSVEPAINMAVDALGSIFQLFGVEPEPFKANHREAEITLMSEAVLSSIRLQHPGDGVDYPPPMQMSTGIGSGASLLMFNPQPEPPGTTDPWLSMMASEMGGASLEMFNTEVNPGPIGSPTIQMNGGTAIGDPSIKLMDSKTDAGGSIKTSEAELSVNGDMGSSLMLHHTEAVGIIPCIRLFAEGAGAGISIFSDPIPHLKRASDSAVINLKADTINAKIEMFGAAPGTEASIVLVSDNSGGKVGINTDAPAAALDVVGDICVTGTVGACSDERYKKNIETITNALALIEKMRGVNFNWRTDEFADKKFSDAEQVGFIAQELKEVLPELVSQGSDGFYSVDYSRLTPVLVEAVKEQQKKIESLDSKLVELQREMESLKGHAAVER